MTPAPYLEISRFGQYVATIRNDIDEQKAWIIANIPHPDFLDEPEDAPKSISPYTSWDLILGFANTMRYEFKPTTQRKPY